MEVPILRIATALRNRSRHAWPKADRHFAWAVLVDSNGLGWLVWSTFLNFRFWLFTEIGDRPFF